MKKISLLVAFTALACDGFSQKIELVLLTGFGANASIYYQTRDNISIVLSKGGNIVEYGTPYDKAFYGYWPGRLYPYTGRVEYYGSTDNESFRGKVKYIGLTMITYYGSYDDEALKGKIKSIGSTQIDYYPSFEDASVKGNIKKIDATMFDYFTSFENEAIKGRLRSIGNTQFTWYTSFDDKSLSGKVKSIGGNVFTYYTSFENNNGQKGQLKSGFQLKYIHGITYYVRK